MLQEKDDQKNMDPQKSTIVVAQIINLYNSIFPEDPAEADRERLMLQVLERCMKSPQGPTNNKVTGDFRVWVYIYNREGETYNLSVSIVKRYIF